MTITRSETPTREPTSREINQAIELLRSARADEQAVRLLDIWNAHRLVEAAQTVGTNEELRNLFTGLKRRNGFVDDGAWS
jgi:hypothetical protein